MEKQKLLESFLGPYTKQGEELLFSCPKCKHKKRKLSINLIKDVFKCWVCEYSGRSVYKLVKRFGDPKTKEAWKGYVHADLSSEFFELIHGKQDEQIIEKIILPKEFKTLLGKDDGYLAESAKKYLKDRGVTQTDINLMKPGYCDKGQYAGRILFPSFNKSGELDYFVSRTFLGAFPPYRNPAGSKNIIFNEFFIDWEEDIVIVEGIFDAIKAGTNAIPLLGSSLREDSRLFKALIKYDADVYLALDPDASKKALGITKRLLEYDLNVYDVPVKPFKDVGEMTKEQFAERKENATKYEFGNFYMKMLENIL